MDEKYKKLYKELEKIKLPENNKNPDENKMKEILNEQDNRYFDDEEMDGVNLSISSSNEKLKQEAQKYCNHKFKIDYWETFTTDARYKLIRTVSCENCDFIKKDETREELSENAFWR